MTSTAPSHPLVSSNPRVRAAYAEGAGIYRIVPAGVAVPEGVADLQAVIRWARETHTPLTARGAGSGIPGNGVGPGVVVDLRDRMPRILEIDPATATAVTSANITQAELNRAALSHGLRLPPDPSSSGWATLGGMVATNAAGARSVRYGPVRPWVMGMELVTSDGEVGWLNRGDAAGQFSIPGTTGQALPAAIYRFRGQVAPAIRAASGLIRERYPRVRKNTAGYALDHWLTSGDDLDLLVGSEGTLGFITAIRWRLHPVAVARAGLRISLRSLSDLEETVRALVALDPSAVELIDRTFLNLLTLASHTPEGTPGDAGLHIPPDAEAVLLVEFERDHARAARGVVGDAVRAVRTVAADVATALTPAEERQLWALRHATSPILASLPSDRRSLQVIEDGCVPLPRIGEYIEAIRQSAQANGITVVIFGHAGDGNVHVNAVPELARLDWQDRVRRLYAEVNDAAIHLGGTVSGEHGDGRLRAPLLEKLYGGEIVELFHKTKAAFDPDGIFNPGVKLALPGEPITGLKLGPDAAPIPDDIAAALREIERTGGYARSRLEIAEWQGAGRLARGLPPDTET
jgi:FAD/FMN-containing dehydrogenase